MERGAQIGGKGLIAFRGRVRTNTTEVSTGWGGVEYTRQQVSYKHAGDEGRPAGLSVFLQRAQGQAGQPAGRQQDGGSLPHQRGGVPDPPSCQT